MSAGEPTARPHASSDESSEHTCASEAGRFARAWPFDSRSNLCWRTFCTPRRRAVSAGTLAPAPHGKGRGATSLTTRARRRRARPHVRDALRRAHVGEQAARERERLACRGTPARCRRARRRRGRGASTRSRAPPTSWPRLDTPAGCAATWRSVRSAAQSSSRCGAERLSVLTNSKMSAGAPAETKAWQHTRERRVVRSRFLHACVTAESALAVRSVRSAAAVRFPSRSAGARDRGGREHALARGAHRLARRTARERA